MNGTKKECYDLALELQKMNPWNKFFGEDPIFVKLPNEKDLFVQFLSADEGMHGIIFFEGEEGLGDLLDSINCDESTMDDEYYLRDASYYSLLFTEYKNIKDSHYDDCCLEKEFKDQPGYIPLFITNERGYIQSKPISKEFKKIKDYLEITKLFLQKLNEESVDYSDNEILSIYLDEDYQTEGIDGLNILYLPFPQMSLRYRNFTCDPIRLNACKSKKRTNDMLTLDAFYTNAPIIEDSLRKPYFPYQVYMLSEKKKNIIDTETLMPIHNRREIIQNMLFSAIENFGIPKGIVVRREEIFGIIFPIIKTLKIDLYDTDWEKLDEINAEISETFLSMLQK